MTAFPKYKTDNVSHCWPLWWPSYFSGVPVGTLWLVRTDADNLEKISEKKQG